MSNSDDEDKADRGNDSAPVAPYKVGYKKPPLHTRFKPGQSGNPSGLAKIPSNFDEMFLDDVPLMPFLTTASASNSNWDFLTGLPFSVAGTFL